ncbi:hypothetical protein J7I93_21310 [Bacillus sp. ISL-47]|nr:hypothetical protein [Bacillus sp. ISL-47]MBT2690681.1 hypothetical protein [Bacillus sp. ISL-47]MBT2709626.1 hypothetical protein [Pseudomonas sp. ISL-84]
MSEFLCCDWFGELSLYDRAAYIENKPVCPECQVKRDTSIVKAEEE